MAARSKYSGMKRVLTKGGLILPNSGHGGMSYVLKGFVLGAFSKKIGKQYLAKSTTEDLNHLATMVEASNLKPVIDKTYSFENIPKGLDYVAKAHARGKVVAYINDQS
jgi:NADPH:quinone reductase-like Zn-dependent oxidoreductase